MKSERPARKIRVLAVVLGLAIFAISCSKEEKLASKSVAQSTVQRYHLKGKVVSIDKQAGRLTVDHEDIPDFMGAMTMPYDTKPASRLDSLSLGDSVTADVVVQDGNYWLENITVTAHGPAPPAAKPQASFHVPTRGELVPNFELVNQSGNRVSLKQYRGKVLLITFIYTRCPFPDYCPRVSGEFTKINRELSTSPALRGKVHLLSISFDPTHDSPKVLREYGFSCVGSRKQGIFAQWEFAVASSVELPKIANYYGLTYSEENGLITHSLSTAVIDPDGRIFQWYHGGDWAAADLLRDAGKALHPPA